MTPFSRQLRLEPRSSIFIMLAIVGFWLSACTDSETPQVLQQEASQMLSANEAAAGADLAAMVLLDRALEMDPNHFPSRLTRASLRAHRQDFAGALTDVEAALSLRGSDKSLALMRCMLIERQRQAPPHACYVNVVKLYRQTSGSCADDLNCVVAASMADMPEASAFRRHFLSRDMPSADVALAASVLRDFDREAYLRSILP